MPGLAFHFPSGLGNNTLPSINQMLKIENTHYVNLNT
jgi:hypothetical protein